ncbi:hypothetical protein HPB48_014932 [Haemaphysalis longicornis]|uniref:DDE-1 domain-containing protein n=1 Tax=Haemaphysalis longicornis TaxID=44386 RepID=A0A9J6FI20_HAELO|nr:hypothetical protein HPB48_014932 [Haemaphysalis longicornis]
MTDTPFEEYVRAIDNKMAKKNRKVLFIVDNCPGHGKIENLEAVKVEFLPANMTSVLQADGPRCHRSGPKNLLKEPSPQNFVVL